MVERRLAHNLTQGLRLLWTHPELPACAECQQWVYDIKTGKRKTHGGQDIPRGRGSPLPCASCPKGKPDSQPHPEKELSDAGWTAYRYVQDVETDPAGQFIPRDRVTLRAVALVRGVREELERTHRMIMQVLLTPGPGKGK